MKVLFVIAATVSCFGLAMQPNAKNTQAVDATVASHVEIEEPVMSVLLDTVVITPVAPQAVAANVH
ncbi:hypothetical protein [Pontibacter virosus]|uniref:Uncharacterized protein n=1 Tax=Pontibacter virosus TaxID=1765052 RepID=A0A2U1B326_9BACT|nr:hypothetical protein [Pontibacter virosus]PVY43079.1 hypothetical protein C8E01_102256 [Pontibacter virosus]